MHFELKSVHLCSKYFVIICIKVNKSLKTGLDPCAFYKSHVFYNKYAHEMRFLTDGKFYLNSSLATFLIPT